MVRFGWILPTIVCLVVTFAMAAPRNHPPQAPASPQIAPYLNPQHLIPIAGGRTINLVCLGQGSPTVVLTAGLGGWSQDVRDEAGQFFRALASGHEAYAALSTRGHTQLVPDSGHFIQFENPTVVLAAIHRVLAEISPPKQSTVH